MSLVVHLHEGLNLHRVDYVDGGSDWNSLLYYQIAVRGHIEIVRPKHLPAPYVMLVNEEGLLKNMDLNPLACWLYGTQEHGSPIVGPAVIVKEVMTDDGPDLAPLEVEDLDSVLTVLWKAKAWFDKHYNIWR